MYQSHNSQSLYDRLAASAQETRPDLGRSPLNNGCNMWPKVDKPMYHK
jgi:hypothetical protein